MTNPNVLTQEVTYEAPGIKKILDNEFVGLLKKTDTTPTVLNLTKFKAVNTAGVNVTYFDDGFDGQTIVILGDGQTTVKYDVTKIKTNTAADKLLAAGIAYMFTRFDKIWVEHA